MTNTETKSTEELSVKLAKIARDAHLVHIRYVTQEGSEAVAWKATIEALHFAIVGPLDIAKRLYVQASTKSERDALRHAQLSGAAPATKAKKIARAEQELADATADAEAAFDAAMSGAEGTADELIEAARLSRLRGC